jgi:hypothetical protein
MSFFFSDKREIKKYLDRLCAQPEIIKTDTKAQEDFRQFTQMVIGKSSWSLAETNMLGMSLPRYSR